MADLTGPNLMVVGGDSKRLQWLTHHVTSHWPNAQVTTLPAGEPAAVNRLIAERTLDAVILQADFADEPAARIALHDLGQMLQIQPGLYCILLADNGDEMTAVRALKSGAKDYLPLARITRDQLLAAIMEACAKRRAATQAVKVVGPAQAEAPGIEVPGYSILKEIATSNFSQVYLARSRRCRAFPARVRDHLQHQPPRHCRDLRLRLPAPSPVSRNGILSLRRPARPPAQSDERGRESVLPARHCRGAARHSRVRHSAPRPETGERDVARGQFARAHRLRVGTPFHGRCRHHRRRPGAGLALLHQPRAVAGAARRRAHRPLQSGCHVL